MNRTEFVRIAQIMATQCTSVLEIGALHKPQLSGASVSYLDVFSTQQLREKYKNDLNVNIDDIVNVSFLSFSDVPDNSMGLAFSSHNVEHQPNLVAHLQELTRLLVPGGEIFFLIPDYRHCFDHYKNESTIGDVLSAFIEKKIKPTPVNILEHHLFSSENRHHWDGFEDPKYTKYPSIERVRQAYNLAIDWNEYKDSHCWKFTPESFRYIIKTLQQLDLINLVLVDVYDTQENTIEFFVRIRKMR